MKKKRQHKFRNGQYMKTKVKMFCVISIEKTKKKLQLALDQGINTD